MCNYTSMFRFVWKIIYRLNNSCLFIIPLSNVQNIAIIAIKINMTSKTIKKLKFNRLFIIKYRCHIMVYKMQNSSKFSTSFILFLPSSFVMQCSEAYKAFVCQKILQLLKHALKIAGIPSTHCFAINIKG